jgi:cell wall-associated NlpC family hydrolase
VSGGTERGSGGTARGSGGTVGYRLGGRASLRVVVVCGLFVALSPPAAQARPRLEGHPKPPSQAQINAAENQVRQHQAAFGAAQGKLSAASAELARLQTQAEVLIERYDQAQVNEQRAASAYQVTEARLRQAERQQAASRLRVARLAARQFESGGGFSPVTVMLGDADGPQAYLRQVGMGQVLAESSTETLAANQANNAVATVFRAQAHKLLVARQAALQAANDLKVAIQAAVSRQQTFVKLTKGKRNKLAGELASAQSKASSLKAARQAALAAAAAERAAAAAAAAAAAGPSGSSQVPSWAWGSGASADQGDIAANWALTQLGKPYLWGGAGPDSFDCSGLTMVAWAHAGVQLLHYTGYQWQEGPHVPLSQLRRGDLLFYATNTSDPSTIHHVAIYIGHGMMVNAPYTGAFVRIDGMYAPGGLIGAVRPAG